MWNIELNARPQPGPTAVELSDNNAPGGWIFSLSFRRGRRGLGRGGLFFLESPSPPPSPRLFLAGRGRRCALAVMPNSMAVHPVPLARGDGESSSGFCRSGRPECSRSTLSRMEKRGQSEWSNVAFERLHAVLPLLGERAGVRAGQPDIGLEDRTN